MDREALARKTQADMVLDRAAEQLRILLEETAKSLRPFPPFPGAFFTNAVEVNLEGVERPEDANYRPRTAVASHGATAEAVTAIYPRPSLELMYRQNLSYVEAHPVVGCTYPGFPIVPPKLTD